jgi:CRP-like cAMP-binding protein
VTRITEKRPAPLRLRLSDGMVAAAVERGCASHEDLFLQNDEATEIYGVLSGRVKLWRSSEDGILPLRPRLTP